MPNNRYIIYNDNIPVNLDWAFIISITGLSHELIDNISDQKISYLNASLYLTQAE